MGEHSPVLRVPPYGLGFRDTVWLALCEEAVHGCGEIYTSVNERHGVTSVSDRMKSFADAYASMLRIPYSIHGSTSYR